MFFYLLFLNTEFLLALVNTTNYNCTDYSKFNVIKNNTKEQNEIYKKRKLENFEFRPINIKYDISCIYNYLFRLYTSNLSEKVEIYNKSISKAINHIKEIISVEKRSIDYTKIHLDNIYKLILDNEEQTLVSLTNDADFIILFRLKHLEEVSLKNYNPQIIYYSEGDKIPLAGSIIIDHALTFQKLNDTFGNNKEYQIELLSKIFFHQITHLLGFKKEILEEKGFLFINPTFISRINPSQQKSIINISDIINLAKTYFNCSNIKGIELNTNVGDLCSEPLHWEERILLGEYMTSNIYYPEQVISDFTLIVLEKLGWYRVKKFTGGLMRFGKHKGCNFLEKDCVKIDSNGNGISSFYNEFCSFDSISTCSSGRLSRGYCFNQVSFYLAQNDGYYRNNWNKNNYGLKSVEYCPISYETKNNNKNSFIGNCRFGTNNFGIELSYGKYGDNSKFFGEFIGDKSFCALSSIIQNNSNIDSIFKNIVRPTCYSMSCSNKSLTIKLYSENKEIEYIVCPRKGGLIHIGGIYSNYSGYFFCPDYNLICTGSKLCNDLFDCIEKESISNDLIYDYNYSINYISSEVRADNETNEKLDKNSLVEGFEESHENDGMCPENCSQCISNKRCILCRNFNNSKNEPYAYYIGEVDNETEHINCSATPPYGGYYNITKYNHIHFFKCVKDCNVCKNAYKCDQCLPTHKINKTDNSCVDKIPFCLEYNTTYFNERDEENGGGKGYIQCLQCNNNLNYFCEDMNKNSCVFINDYTRETYYNMEDNNPYSCVQKCNKKFEHCIKCDKNRCKMCEPDYFINDTGYCKERIPHCIEYNESYFFNDNDRNGGGKSFIECSRCNNPEGYYCLNMNKTVCHSISNYSDENYFKMENTPFPCIHRYIKGCKEYTQNQSLCKICEPEFVVNEAGYCEERIHHCLKYRNSSAFNDTLRNGGGIGYRECDQCDNSSNYYCFEENRTTCQKLNPEDKRYYFEMSDDSYPCLNNCSLKYPYCLECNKTNCITCLLDKSKNGSCFAPISNCLEYEKKEDYNNVEYLECKKCAQNKSYYCIDNERKKCEFVNDIENYYRFDDDDENSCLGKCEVLFKDCKKCNKTQCLVCSEGNVLSNKDKTKCLPILDYAKDNECKILMHEIDIDIKDLNVCEYFIDFYFINSLPYTKIVEHFVNENYTATMFIYSECTEDLLNQGYYKIDSDNLYNQMYIDAEIEANELLFSIFITNNYQNYYSFCNFYTEYINETTVCPKCLNIPYNITNKYKNTLTNLLGPLISDLIQNEKINIFSKESEIFTDFCTNLTLKGVDIPLDDRLQYLYLNDYSTQIACTDKNCEIKQIFPEQSISVCECKLGSKLEDIKGPIITLTNYKNENSTLSDSISESFKIIKCANKGLKKSNLLTNGGFFITAIAIVLIIVCFIVYCIYSKVINLEKGANPPSKKLKNRILLDCDCQKKSRDISNFTDDIIDNDLIQSRDEDENNYTEEDFTFTRKYDESSYSIDTEIGVKKKIEQDHDKDSNDINKGLSEKKSRKILVLLSNKKKFKKAKDKNSEASEEFEFIPTEEIKKRKEKNFCQIYWFILSIKQHIINYFSSVKCCRITDSYIPLPIRFIKSLFLLVLSLILNALFLTQYYFSEKFKYFNSKYKLIVTKTDEITVVFDEITEGNIPKIELWKYAFFHTYINAIIVFAVLIVVEFLIGIIFFSLRNSVLETIRSNDLNDIKNLISKARIKYIVFFILCLILLAVFLFSFIGFGSSYGGAFIDYLVPDFVSIAIFEVFPFIWSIFLAIFRYIGYKKGNKCCYEFSRFFLF